MNLHFLKNNRTFEVQNEAEQSHSNFINQNRPRRSGASPATSVYPARSAATWALFITFYLMQNEKNIPLEAPKRTLFYNPTLQVTKVDCEGPDQFAIHVKVHNKSATVIRFGNPNLLEEIVKSLSKTNQQPIV